jgi:hypothetical protein
MSWLTKGSALKAAEARARARAGIIRSAFGAVLQAQSDVETSWAGSFTQAGIEFEVAFGAEVVREGLAHAIHEWTKLVGRSTTAAEGAWEVRSPRRTAFEYHDGLPGETPNLITPRGVPLCAPQLAGAARTQVAHWVDELPRGVALVTWRKGEITLRANGELVDPQSLQSLVDAELKAFEMSAAW